MHVVEPARYRVRSKKRRQLRYLALPAVFIVVLGAVNYLRPLPAAILTLGLSVPAPAAPGLAWPAGGQAAVAAAGYGLLDTSGDQTPFPTASIAKVITALCVLQKEPLSPGQSGPTYTVDATDVTIYDNYAAEDGSLLPVHAGEQLSEYQALESLMVPSANNIADSLARWVFGSQTAYSAYATEFLQQHGLDSTHIGSDASGFDPSTVSTASDLSQLGLLALKNPVLMNIAGQKSAELPIIGTAANYDTVLGQSGISGLKTGNNAVDMGAFLFTAAAHVAGRTIPISGAVMGAPNLTTALHESVQLASSLERGFELVSITQAGQTVGSLRTAWGASAPVTTPGSLRLVRWKATPVTKKHRVNRKLRSGTVGTLSVTSGPNSAASSLHLAHPLAAPSFWWRLTRH